MLDCKNFMIYITSIYILPKTTNSEITGIHFFTLKTFTENTKKGKSF